MQHVAGTSTSHPQIIGFGNNVSGNLVSGGPSIIRRPERLDVICEQVLWHSWTCTVIKESGGAYRTWGAGAPNISDFAGVKRMIGVDAPVAILRGDGTVRGIDGKPAAGGGSWNDVATNGSGITFASKRDGIYRFETFEDFMSGRNAFGPLAHPLLNGNVRLHATESRCLARTVGNAQHLIELLDTRTLPPTGAKTNGPVSIQVLEEFEGLGVQTVICGSANRFGVITDAGDGYIVDKNQQSEALDFGDEEVRFLGVGTDFEIVVTNSGVYSRGSNLFGQLGLDGSKSDFTRLPLEHENVIGLHTARWSTLLVVAV